METWAGTNEEQARYWNGDESAVAVESVAEPLWMGADVLDAVAFFKSTGIWARLIGDADPPTVARVSEAVQAALEPHVTPDGLMLGSQTWLVTASRPWR